MKPRSQSIASKNVSKQNVRTGAGSRAVSVDWVGQQGTSLGNKVMGRGEPLKGIRAQPFKTPSFDPIAQGDALATNVGKGGFGTGRTLYGDQAARRVSMARSRALVGRRAEALTTR
jgi:hypothetical protein